MTWLESKLGRTASRTRLGPADLPRLAVLAAAVLLGAYFVLEGVGLAQQSYREIKADYEFSGVPAMPNSDFPMFYAGARLVRSSDRANTYDLHTIVRAIMIGRGYTDTPEEPPTDTEYTQWQRYYNPPVFLLALSPLTLLDLQTAYLVVTAVNLVLLVALALLIGCILRWQQPVSSLMVLALFGFSPVYFALHHAQPTILLSVLLSAGFLSLRDGRYRRAGVLLSLMSMKPQWLFPPVVATTARPRLFMPLLLASAAVVLLPFLLLGPRALLDYVALTMGRGSEDLSNADFAGSVLSWVGFFRGLTGEVEPGMWLGASLVTIGVFLVAWRYGRIEYAISSATVVCLIVVPHSHPQDWVTMLPVAAMLLAATTSIRARMATVVLLLAVYAGANDWPSAHADLLADGEAVFWATLAAFALLVQLALSSFIESRNTSRRTADDRLVYVPPPPSSRKA